MSQYFDDGKGIEVVSDKPEGRKRSISRTLAEMTKKYNSKKKAQDKKGCQNG